MRWIPCVTLYYLLSTQLCGTWGGPGPTGLYLPRLLKGQLSSLRSKLETKTGGSLKKEEILYRPTLGSGSKVAVLVAQLCPTLRPHWMVARQAPLSMGFSREEYWSGFPFPSPEGLPDPGIEPGSPALAGGLFTVSATGKIRRRGLITEQAETEWTVAVVSRLPRILLSCLARNSPNGWSLQVVYSWQARSRLVFISLSFK